MNPQDSRTPTRAADRQYALRSMRRRMVRDLELYLSHALNNKGERCLVPQRQMSRDHHRRLEVSAA